MINWTEVYKALDEKIWSKCPSCAAGRFYAFLGGVMGVLLMGLAVLFVVVGNWVVLNLAIAGLFFILGSKVRSGINDVKKTVDDRAQEQFDKEQAKMDEMLRDAEDRLQGFRAKNAAEDGAGA